MWNPSEFVGPEAASTAQDLMELGWMPGQEAPHPLAYLDPIADDDLRGDEDARGVAVMRHPEAILRDDSELWNVVDRMRAGCPLEVSHIEHDTLPSWEIDARLIMLSAQRREEQRMLRSQEDGD